MKILQYILVSILSLGVVSCSDWLDLRPDGETVLEDFWTQEGDVEAVVMTCYREMQEDDFMKRLIVWGELRSDNLQGGSDVKDDEKEMLAENLLPSNGNSKWDKFYSVINFCNTVLTYGAQAQKADPDFMESSLRAYYAEATTLRAICYFYLVRAFGDVPYIDEPSIDDNQNYQIPQMNADELLEKLVEQLLEAEKGAMSSYGEGNYYSYNPTKGRITKNAVRALLADIYLWQSDYDNCIKYCDKIVNEKIVVNNIEEDRFSLVEYEDDPYYSIFGTGNSSESIFELQYTSTVKNNDIIESFYGKYDSQEGQLIASNFMATVGNVFKSLDNDSRRNDSFKEKEIKGAYYIFKYTGMMREVDKNGSSYYYRSSSANWIFYRLSDILLMKAEALVQLNRGENDLKAALSLANIVYKRSNPTLTTDTLKWEDNNSQEKMEELVLLERQREFLFEGKRWFDLLRMARRDGNTDRLIGKVIRKQTDNQVTIRNKLKDMNALYMPINEEELKVNKLLKQNPYYEFSTTTEDEE